MARRGRGRGVARHSSAGGMRWRWARGAAASAERLVKSVREREQVRVRGYTTARGDELLVLLFDGTDRERRPSIWYETYSTCRRMI